MPTSIRHFFIQSIPFIMLCFSTKNTKILVVIPPVLKTLLAARPLFFFFFFGGGGERESYVPRNLRYLKAQQVRDKVKAGLNLGTNDYSPSGHVPEFLNGLS